jgi:hypothetical protein
MIDYADESGDLGRRRGDRRAKLSFVRRWRGPRDRLRGLIMWRRFWARLRRLFSRTKRIPVVPKGACTHELDSEAIMHRLLLAHSDPLKFAEELSVFANCRICATAVLAQCVYELGGLVLVDQGDAESVEFATCGHAVNPEIIAMRLTLNIKSRDPVLTAQTLAECYGCPDCLESVALSLGGAHVAVLDTVQGVEWEPLVARQLASAMGWGEKK